MDGILYISRADIAALGITPGAARSALARIFRAHAEKRTEVPPKLTVPIAPGHFFQSLCAASAEPPLAATKWVGVAAENAGRGLANVNGLVILSDRATGVPVAILDGNSLTVLRTAAMSALAAQHLARADSRSLGLVGCGAQAHGHLPALRDVLPGIRRVVCFSRTAKSAQRVAAAARALGFEALVTDNADEALACDVIVTSVPAGEGTTAFLDARHLRPGAFVSAVDLGRSWRSDSLRHLDVIATDDQAQAADPTNRAKLAIPGPFDADLASLVSGATGRTDPMQRTMFLFPGLALADLAVAAEILAAARAAGRGTFLPR
jgi:ornithine cyclodeaminase/alanine dehydrogenase